VITNLSFPHQLGALYGMLDEAIHDDDETRYRCIQKASVGAGLDIREAASIITAPEEWSARIAVNAAGVNEVRYGKQIAFYGVVYIHDACINECVYCGNSRRIRFTRRILSKDELLRDVRALTALHDFREICFLMGEAPDVFTTQDLVDYLRAVASIYRGKIILNIAPLSIEDFSRIRQALPDSVLQFRVFQETYDLDTYKATHLAGPKADMYARIDAQRRALDAGFDEVGHGILYGLNAKPFGAEFDTLATLAHVSYLKSMFGKWSRTMSFPRIQPVLDARYNVPSPVSDSRLARCIASVKLALPVIETVITCREKADLRRTLRPIVNVEDYAARPGPGGNSAPEVHTQMLLPDTRSGEEIKQEMIRDGYTVH